MPKNTFGQIWELNFQEKITFYWFEERYQTKSFGSPKIWTQGSILTYLKKKLVQIGHVWTVSDNNFLLFFENGSHFWTAVTLQLVAGFGQVFFNHFLINISLPDEGESRHNVCPASWPVYSKLCGSCSLIFSQHPREKVGLLNKMIRATTEKMYLLTFEY